MGGQNATTSQAKVQEEIPYDEDFDSYDIDDETMTLLVNKFSKFLRKKGALRRFQQKEPRDSTKKGKNAKDKITCHECEKVGHMKFSCPTILKRVENKNKESMHIKAKKAYIIWNVSKEEATSSTLDEDESTKLCLMTQNHEFCETYKQDNSSELSISDSDDFPTYESMPIENE
ncbi:hypothetical protein Lal_00024903 [Lupinus albus]|nr:hypothetical protein Lal_00024903 [Lupinus albus]